MCQVFIPWMNEWHFHLKTPQRICLHLYLQFPAVSWTLTKEESKGQILQHYQTNASLVFFWPVSWKVFLNRKIHSPPFSGLVTPCHLNKDAFPASVFMGNIGFHDSLAHPPLFQKTRSFEKALCKYSFLNHVSLKRPEFGQHTRTCAHTPTPACEQW